MSYSYSVEKRDTKKHGIVYDVRFRIKDADDKEMQKKLCGYASQKEAKKAYMEFIATYAPPVKKIVDDSPLYDDALASYFGYVKSQLKEASYYDKIGIFRLFITPYFEHKKINELTKQAIYLWQDALWSITRTDNAHLGQHYSSAYLSKIRTNFGNFLSWCEQRYDLKNFMADVKKPKSRKPKTEMHIWEYEEFMQFIGCVDDILWKTFFMLFYYTGCRIGEGLALGDNDFTGTSIKINKSLTKKILKTPRIEKLSNYQTFKIVETKNYKDRETLIPEVLSSQIEKYLQWKKENGIGSTYFFGGEKPLSQTNIRRVFDRYTILSNVNRIKIHELRHSFVSLLVHLGANFAIVADFIGDTIEVVAQTYV
ncbi:MAG: tyrosine-type recombinase/integrase, partial [Clostridia bacterium]